MGLEEKLHDVEPRMDAVLQLARQCGHQQRLLKLNSSRQEKRPCSDALCSYRTWHSKVNERVSAVVAAANVLHQQHLDDGSKTISEASPGAPHPKLKRGNSALSSSKASFGCRSEDLSKAEGSSDREALFSAKKALNGMSPGSKCVEIAVRGKFSSSCFSSKTKDWSDLRHHLYTLALCTFEGTKIQKSIC
eukprot:g453.t1